MMERPQRISDSYWVYRLEDIFRGAKFVQVEGKPVSLGVKGADFFMHRSLDGQAWTISEGMTGTMIACDRFKKDVLRIAREKFERADPQGALDRAIDTALYATGGYSPRYGGVEEP